jgi:hypothetical protein
MPINQNHLFDELNGIKCAIVEKNATKERVDFLKQILEYNHYTVVIVASPPPKTAPQGGATPIPAAIPEASTEAAMAIPGVAAQPLPEPETFTVGVTDVTFNPINAIFGRLLKAPGRHIITLAYWQQKDKEPQDEVPYFNNKKQI